MRIYTVTASDLVTQSFTSLETEVYTDLKKARADFLDGTPFETWADLEGFADRFNSAEDRLTDDDRAKLPGLDEGSPAEVRVDETGAFWHDGALDGVSLSLETHLVNVH